MNLSEATLFRIFDSIAAVVLAAIYFGVAHWLFRVLFPGASHAVLDTVAGIGAIIMGRVSFRMFKSVNPKG
ncbi:hypothetical protein PSP6_690006 [Paraburkholderia tropica]|uniref:hypothetical protein n=1 Tax=Paraburkholderia tropica TaxID=92647 RepID=UPI001CAF6B14|nr:hypothetical protein [Paraburkholderia tropica]CAG9235592.1 hypothetical protein PSP6_690006 [Paraburkholderia tropica]